MTLPITTLVNGEAIAHVSAQDRSVQYGDGLFETIAVRDGEPLLWDRHLVRLAVGARRLGFTSPDHATLSQEARALCQTQGRAVLKIIVSRGVGGRGYAPPTNAQATRVLSLYPWPDFPVPDNAAGVPVRVCRTRLADNPALAGIKHLNRLEQVLARGEWTNGYTEGLMLGMDERVVEGTMSNVFAVIDGTLLTPDVSRAGVEGVMRGLILERAQAILASVRVADLRLADLLRATEIFLTNSLIGIWPVVRIDGDGVQERYAVGSTTQKLQRCIADAVSRA